MGPLHGLPVSLKDQFHVKGVDTTMGYVGWIGGNCGVLDESQVHQVESQITKDFLSVGAVLYCKVMSLHARSLVALLTFGLQTSLPQTVFVSEHTVHTSPAFAHAGYSLARLSTISWERLTTRTTAI